ncbi:Inositol monophosphatase family [Musa troglodytarum]|uniref:Inositol monophosphatase family n=1 Tax=Musa troglodytarum TaxID=320322 RepID=A0A9E7HPA7_9LILI|nr:Inositol monophosphatase family [Musa troglodytarum]
MSSDVLENPSPRRWRFTWETLAHIPTLRLYLFHPDVHPSALCGNLSASLRLDQSLLRVSWIDDRTGEGTGDVVFLRVPVPKVLVDPSCPVECRAMDDHIEIKLALVLPVDHPVMMDLRGVLDSDMGEMGRQECGLSDRLLPLPLDMGYSLKIRVHVTLAIVVLVQTLCGNAISELERWLTIGLELAAVLLEVSENSAEEELSYRIIVRDLKLKSPMLLLVLLNSKAWSSSGYCSEDSMGSLSAVDLQPVLKVEVSNELLLLASDEVPLEVSSV